MSECTCSTPGLQPARKGSWCSRPPTLPRVACPYRRSRRWRGESRRVCISSRPSPTSNGSRRAGGCPRPPRGQDGGWVCSRCSSSVTVARTRLRPARSRAKALDRIFESWSRSAPEHVPGQSHGGHVAALHALSPDTAEDMLDRIHEDDEPGHVVRRVVQSGDGGAHGAGAGRTRLVVGRRVSRVTRARHPCGQRCRRRDERTKKCQPSQSQPMRQMTRTAG